MNKCENCRLRKESAIAFDIHWHDEDDCPYAHCPVPDFPQTNYDLVISKTPEELAEWMATVETGVNTYGDDVYSHWLSWLKAPVEVDE